jgi:hypothetical protein
MADNEIASKVFESAEENGGSLSILELPSDQIEYALRRGWLRTRDGV